MIQLDEEEVRSLFSEYLEGSLSPEVRDSVQVFLSGNPELAAELIQYERTLSILHRLPPREPVLDMWSDVAPEARKYRSEMRWPLRNRIRNRWFQGVAAVSEGIIHGTHSLAEWAHTRFSKHLLHGHHRENAVHESGSEL